MISLRVESVEKCMFTGLVLRVPYRSFPLRIPFNSARFHTMTSTVDILNAELAQQTELFNKLRIDNSDPVALEESRKRLGEIKRELATLKPGGKDAKKKDRLLLKTPKVRLSTLVPMARTSTILPRARATMVPARCSVATM
jgi:hypothetical protein